MVMTMTTTATIIMGKAQCCDRMSEPINRMVGLFNRAIPFVIDGSNSAVYI